MVWVITNDMGDVYKVFKKKENVLSFIIERLEGSDLTPDECWKTFYQFFLAYSLAKDDFSIKIGERTLFAELKEIADEGEE